VRSATVKRAMDLVGSAVALVAGSIPMAILAFLVRRDLGRPVFFLQERAGRDGKPFTLVKFRTMRDGDEPDEERLTKFGQFLRSASLDELPSLWNVLRGDMSLVGPRPLLTRYLDRYSPLQARRHEVKPGLTGLAQVKGRNLLSWDVRLKLDVEYVDTWTLPGDIVLLFQTIGPVFRRVGVAAEGQATMTEFAGPTMTEFATPADLPGATE
jgi:sugar transferase EpsL